jgi:hypothetical protein
LNKNVKFDFYFFLVFFFLNLLHSADKAMDSIFYSYTRNINGFAANLNEEEAAEIESKFLRISNLFCFSGMAENGFFFFLLAENPNVLSVFELWLIDFFFFFFFSRLSSGSNYFKNQI